MIICHTCGLSSQFIVPDWPGDLRDNITHKMTLYCRLTRSYRSETPLQAGGCLFDLTTVQLCKYDEQIGRVKKKLYGGYQRQLSTVKGRLHRFGSTNADNALIIRTI